MEVTTKKIETPALRFPEFKDRWLPDLLGKTIEVVMGQSPDSKSYNESGKGEYLIQGNADMSNRLTSPRQWTSEPTKICEKGDLILTVRAPVGAVGKSIHRACIGRGVCALKAKNGFNKDFIYQFLLQYESKWKRIEQGSTFTAISGNDIKKIKLNIPQLPEQQKIASFLTKVDDKIAQLTKKAELLEQYKKGVMQKIFKQELRFKDDNGKEFPKWEKMALSKFLITTLREVEKPKSNYLAIGVRSHCKGTFQKPETDPNDNSMEKLYQVEPNDLIVNITFAWESAIAIVEEKDKGGLVSHRFPTYTFNNKLCISDFFRYVIVQRNFRHQLDLISPGGAGRNRVLSKSEFLKLKWELPCVEEQTKIANFLQSIDKKIEQVHTQLTQAKTWKKGLLQKMFV